MRDSSIVDSKDIKFACSQCGQHIVVERSAAGLDGTCPVCNHPITIPRVDPILDKSPPSDSPQHEAGRDQARWQKMGLEEARLEIGRQHSLFRKAVDECERLNANATHIQAESKRFQSDRQQLKTDLAVARQAAAMAETQAAQLTEALVTAQLENSGLRQQIENELVVLRERLAATETQLVLRENDLHESRAENSQIVQALAQGQAELAALTAEAAGLRKDVASHRQDAETTAQHLAATGQQLSETEVRLQTLDEAHRQSSRERDEWRQQAETLRHDLSSIGDGRELLEIRDKQEQLQKAHRISETALAQRTEEASAAVAKVETLHAELHESRLLHADAERRAQAGSESQLHKDIEVLRGILDRQNATLALQHTDLRRLRRGRIALRLVYALFALGLLALGYVAFKVIDPQDFARVFSPAEFTRMLKH